MTQVSDQSGAPKQSGDLGGPSDSSGGAFPEWHGVVHIDNVTQEAGRTTPLTDTELAAVAHIGDHEHTKWHIAHPGVNHPHRWS